ncbi:MAG TPA: ATP-binding protein [Candidatus Deferrimicrobium sp.]|nr:ATP-binding protein [Candidatus Deferrimicrobium sp.]
MRRFNSYGPINTNIHYYAPRKDLIAKSFTRLVGENPSEGGHYITVWAPRQTGKTWVMQEILFQLKENPLFDVLKINLEILKDKEDTGEIINVIARKIGEGLGKKISGINNQDQFQEIFKKDVLDKPLILILDEFDALSEKAINTIVSAFRNIHISRTDEKDKSSEQKTYLLHAVALIGVRSVLGIENEKGSPFNIQRSIHISNLSFEEVKGMFEWYEQESGQEIEPAVIEKLYQETAGQPGLTCWLGELLTEGFEDYHVDKSRTITLRDFDIVYAAATYALPNNTILNIISKANKEPNKTFVFDMFQTNEKLEFKFDNKIINALYMNGIADKQVVDQTRYYLKFSSPFVQKRLFNYFSYEMFRQMGTLVEPFTSLDEMITDTGLNIKNLLGLYEEYLVKNKDWLFKDAPRRNDLRIYEAVYHFNLFSYLNEFLREKGGCVVPEFPTGNGKIDLLIKYKGKLYGIELKSYKDQAGFKMALKQAALYGKRLELGEIFLSVFVEYIDEKNRAKYEVDYLDEEIGVTVKPVFIATGN